MAGPIQISTVLKLIQTCVNKGQTASSNHDTCIHLTDSLSMAVEILQDIQSNNHLTLEARKKVDRLLQRLSDVTSEANDQFDKCHSHNISGKISTFLHASSIKDKLGKLQGELQTIMSMLSVLLLHVEKPTVNDKWIKASDESNNSLSQEKEPPNQDQRVPCRWGLNCRNIRDNQHCTKYSHPGIPCKWGAKCYDHSDSHRAKFSHPKSNTQQ